MDQPNPNQPEPTQPEPNNNEMTNDLFDVVVPFVVSVCLSLSPCLYINGKTLLLTSHGMWPHPDSAPARYKELDEDFGSGFGSALSHLECLISAHWLPHEQPAPLTIHSNVWRDVSNVRYPMYR